MIINVRGTNGSGKTYVVKHQLDRFGQVPLLGSDGKVQGHALGCGARVVGRYTTPTGGCDTIHTQDEVQDRVGCYAALGDTLFEGLLVSATYERWAHFAREYKEKDFRLVYLNTTVEECIARVEARRRVAGNEKPLNPDNLVSKHRATQLNRERFIANGFKVWYMGSAEAADQVEYWLEGSAV